MSAPPPAGETLDGPFQSEKGRFQEIDGELRRVGSAAARRERAAVKLPLLGDRAMMQIG
jgi:hypothetical protein